MKMLLTEQFAAMGTTCATGVTTVPADVRGARRALAAGRAEVDRCERALSRFDPASDLSRLNAASGSWIHVDERLVDVLARAVRLREQTRGRFDPTILPALVAAGYDRTFAELEPRAPRTAAGWRAGAAVDVDVGAGRARVEDGAAVDLGGIGKGFSAVRALDAMAGAWPEMPGGLVDLGGDVSVRGWTPDGDAWRVAVADPRRPGQELATLALDGGGVATSGRDRRRFGPNRSLHHLIDPKTGTPAAAGPLSVTVTGPDAGEAEAYATALAISSPDDSRALLAAVPLLAALVVPTDGTPFVLGSLPLLEPRLHLPASA
ncbi:MAG: FAD:protein FMN transferase [Verrucomicrobiota bacterium]